VASPLNRELNPAGQGRAQRTLHQAGKFAEDGTNQGLVGVLQVGKQDAQNRVPAIPAQHVGIAQQIGHSLNEAAKGSRPGGRVGDAGPIHKDQQQAPLVTLGTPALQVEVAGELRLIAHRQILGPLRGQTSGHSFGMRLSRSLSCRRIFPHEKSGQSPKGVNQVSNHAAFLSSATAKSL